MPLCRDDFARIRASVPVLFTIGLALVLAGCRTAPRPGGAGKSGVGVEIQQVPGKPLVIRINGEPFSQYHYEGVTLPYLYPLLGPGGEFMTRHWPMEDVPDEEHDHPHHRSFWFAHGDVNGVDLWSESSKAGRTEHVRFLEVRSGRDQGVIRTENRWVDVAGKVLGTDERALVIRNTPGVRTLDYSVTLHATQGDVVLGDTKEGTMALRLAETMRLKGKVGKGHIVNSEGVRDGETWGKRARWVDYHGPVGGREMGVAMFDHPSNPRHPTWWHVRDYGLFAANPFGIHDFEKASSGAGRMTVRAGQSVTFKYRILIHPGDELQGRVAQRYAEYLSQVR